MVLKIKINEILDLNYESHKLPYEDLVYFLYDYKIGMFVKSKLEESKIPFVGSGETFQDSLNGYESYRIVLSIESLKTLNMEIPAKKFFQFN